MNARDDFAIWLKGYLDGNPEGADEKVKEQLEQVIGAIVAERLRARQYETVAGSTFGPLSGLIGSNKSAIARPEISGVGVSVSHTSGQLQVPPAAQGVHWGVHDTTSM